MMPTLLMNILYLILALFILFLFFKNHRNKVLLLPPGPRGLPIIGNLHQLNNSIIHQQLWQLSKKYGPIFSLKLGLRNAIVVSSHKLAKETLKNHDLEFSGRPKLLVQQKISYNGLNIAFSQYNSSWREIRKICVAHIFSVSRVSSFSTIREFEVKHMINKISRHASSSKITNLSEISTSLTSTIICRIVFGRSYEEDEGVGRSKFHGLFSELQFLLSSFFVSDYIPFLGWMDRLRGLYSRLEQVFKEIDKFVEEVIDEHMNPNRNIQEGEDIVDVLLQLKKERSSSMEITNDHIKAVLLDILVAATDTMASTTVWIMTELIKNPRVMKKAQEEIRSLGGKKDFLEEDDVQEFTYVKAVIKETLRFHPPLPLLLPRETNEECIIDGYNIPAKTFVYVNALAIHRDSEVWKDPEKFYPERFLDSSIDFRGQDFELIPFGAGRRMCPGLRMAVISLELIIVNLLYLFDWKLPEGMIKEDINTETLPGLVHHKKNPLCLIAKRHV